MLVVLGVVERFQVAHELDFTLRTQPKRSQRQRYQLLVGIVLESERRVVRMLAEADGDHVWHVPRARFTQLALCDRLLQPFQLGLVREAIIVVVDLELVQLQHRPLILIDEHCFIELPFAGVLQHLVEPVNLVHQQVDQGVHPFTYDAKRRGRELVVRDVQRIAICLIGTELHQPLPIDLQVAPAPLQLVVRMSSAC